MRTAARTFFAMLATTIVAASLLAAPAAAATKYDLTGIETAAMSSTSMFAGVLTSQPGTWQATIVHGDLNKTPNGVTTISSSGGSFTLAPFAAPPTGGTITGGQLVAGAPTGLFFCTQQFLVTGSLASAGGTGSFQGTLTHYGIRSQGVCNAFFATFAGSVTLP